MNKPIRNLLRTPEDRFRNLPEYPFTPRYVEIDGARMHYLDEGSGQIALCLHGEPTWSYLYRRMIPILARKHRVIAPDFIGFGRSDKYEDPKAYSFHQHYFQLSGFVHHLGLEEITLVCHDWGGLLGLSLVGEKPELFRRLVILNTALPIGGPISESFMEWRAHVLRTPDLEVGRLLRRAVPSMTQETAAAYDAPFPDVRYKGGVHAFPALVPIHAGAPGVEEMRRARTVLSKWTKPVLVIFSDNDPVLSGGERFFCELIPSCTEPVILEGAGHFLQESRGEEIAGRIDAWGPSGA